MIKTKHLAPLADQPDRAIKVRNALFPQGAAPLRF